MELTLGTKTLLAIEQLRKTGIKAKTIDHQPDKDRPVQVEIAVARLVNDELNISVTSSTLVAIGDIDMSTLENLKTLAAYNKSQLKLAREYKL